VDEALQVLRTLLALVAVVIFWLLVLFVFPGYLALWVSSWFPQTGQWRRVWRDWRQRRHKRDSGR